MQSLCHKIPWRRKWQSTPVFLPREFHGQRSLAGYSPWGHKLLGTIEQLSPFRYRGLSVSSNYFSASVKLFSFSV